MRTTLTLADDVAAAIKELRRVRNTTLEELVNETLREGLKQMRRLPRRETEFHTRVVNLGRPLSPSIDNIGEVMAIAEGGDYK